MTRYLGEPYAGQFMDEGKLRLSSFKAFQKHADENRGDAREGLPQVESKAAPTSGSLQPAASGQITASAQTPSSQTASHYFYHNFENMSKIHYADSI